ncbi:unnamed protein product [Phaedon cochleariae]|uniref:CRAL-TRIO domain-containing protein n=1 Tax=Phaedon cochleariae TaxID=80249 RepID=A0A9P0GVH7_PHACE|nr:unnamed protein product [Phaedon cochleariae]
MLQISEVEYKAILKHHNVSEREFLERVQILKEWMEKSDLPIEDTLGEKLKLALINCKLSLEKSKRCIEGYYRIRTLYADFFDRLVPDTEDYKQAKRLGKTVFMPKLTPDLCRIAIFRVDDPNGEANDGLQYEIVAIMGAEMRIMSGDCALTNIIILDFRDFGLKNIIKYTPNVQHKIVNIMIAVNLRIKNIHLVNLPPMIDKLITLIRAVLPAKFFDKICFHQNFESLYEYIPKEYLPKDYDGTQSTIDELQEMWCAEMEKHVDKFKKLVVSAKCPRLLDTKVPENVQFGTDGSFRQLTLD